MGAKTLTPELVRAWQALLAALPEATRVERRAELAALELALGLRDGRRQRWQDPARGAAARERMRATWARKRALPSVELRWRATGEVELLTLEAAAARVHLRVGTLRQRLTGGRACARLLDEDVVTLRRLTPAERALCTSDAPQA